VGKVADRLSVVRSHLLILKFRLLIAGRLLELA
jgi:hypothetical protein